MATITTTDGLSLHVETRGDRKARPVLFLHGFPLTSAMWAPAVERLDPKRWRAILPDLRGHGKTPPFSKLSPETEPVTIGRFAQDMADVLDGIGERGKVVVVGLSMGGYIAFEFVRRFPDRVRGLVLADTRATADTEEAARAREMQAHTVLREGSRSLADAMLPRLVAKKASEELRGELHGIMSATDPKGIAMTLRMLARRPDFTPMLPGIAFPTLVVVGEKDQVTPPDVARGMHAAIPGSKLEVIPDAGHLPPVEQPERFAAVLTTFLDGLPVGG